MYRGRSITPTDYRRVIVAIGPNSSLTPETIAEALDTWYLRGESQIVAMPKAKRPPQELGMELRRKNPCVETCVVLQGGEVPVVENGQQVKRAGEWAYVLGPDGAYYCEIIKPDLLFMHQQHMKQVHGMPVDNELPEERAPANVLLGLLTCPEHSGTEPLSMH